MPGRYVHPSAAFVELLAGGEQGVDVTLHGGIEMRRVALGFTETAGDDLAHGRMGNFHISRHAGRFDHGGGRRGGAWGERRRGRLRPRSEERRVGKESRSRWSPYL